MADEETKAKITEEQAKLSSNIIDGQLENGTDLKEYLKELKDNGGTKPKNMVDLLGDEAGSNEATCALTAASEAYKNLETMSSKRVRCSQGCVDMNFVVFGPATMELGGNTVELFDEESSICRSAIQAGVIGPEGGDV